MLDVSTAYAMGRQCICLLIATLILGSSGAHGWGKLRLVQRQAMLVDQLSAP